MSPPVEGHLPTAPMEAWVFGVALGLATALACFIVVRLLGGFCVRKPIGVTVAGLVIALVTAFVWFGTRGSYAVLAVPAAPWLLLSFVQSAGTWSHGRVDGGADRRYRDNAFLHAYSIEVRSMTRGVRQLALGLALVAGTALFAVKHGWFR